MGGEVQLFYDFGSPASYLAFKQLPVVARRAGASVVLRPFLLGGVFKATGNRSPIEINAKAEWIWQDLANHARRYGVAFRRNSHFPINTLHLMRGAYAIPAGELDRYSDAMFEAVWVDDLDMNQPAVVKQVLEKAGFDAGGVFAGVETEQVKSRLRQVTDEAVARGVFGAPTMMVGDTLFFGQDRLDFVEEALGRTGSGEIRDGRVPNDLPA